MHSHFLLPLYRRHTGDILLGSAIFISWQELLLIMWERSYDNEAFESRAISWYFWCVGHLVSITCIEILDLNENLKTIKYARIHVEFDPSAMEMSWRGDNKRALITNWKHERKNRSSVEKLSLNMCKMKESETYV